MFGTNPTSNADTVNRWWYYVSDSGIVTLCWITNWFIQSHWPTDDARRMRMWEWWTSIRGPYWQRDWGTLPNDDTNSSSWVSNHVLPKQKSTTLTLQKLAGRTLRVNGIWWPEKQTLRHSINKTTKTNTVGRALFWVHFQVFFLPLCTTFPLSQSRYMLTLWQWS
jgi:hypothetical protein